MITDGEWNGNPVWSPDGRRVAFTSNRQGPFYLYQRNIETAGGEEVVLDTPEGKSPNDWSSDGRFILYRDLISYLHFDLMAIPLDGDRKPVPIAHTNSDEREGQFSPDGKWVAYQSNESGRYEIYVQSFPNAAGKTRISAEGGSQVRWRHDAKEIFYVAQDGRLMAAPIRLNSAATTIEPGVPMVLFRPSNPGRVMASNFKAQYAVSRDGQRFLINTVLAEATTSPITLILNWKATAPAGQKQ